MTAEKVGYMMKEGGSIKTWKKRWFVLKDGELSYYKSDKDKEVTGVITLDSATAIHKGERKKHPNYFEIVTPSRCYAFSAETEDSRTEWVSALLREWKKVQNTNRKVRVEDFDLLNLVGKGSFGKVMQVRKKDTGKIYAMKVLDKKHILEHNKSNTRLRKRISFNRSIILS
jgi:serine/threonine protein kinase